MIEQSRKRQTLNILRTLGASEEEPRTEEEAETEEEEESEDTKPKIKKRSLRDLTKLEQNV